MKSIQRWVIAMLAIALPLCILAACGEESAEKPSTSEAAAAPAPEPAADVPADHLSDRGELRYSGETEDGMAFNAQMGGDIVMPSMLPEGFPFRSGGTPHSAMEAGDTALVTIDYPEDGPLIFRFYIKELGERGWRVENQMDLGSAQTLTATKNQQKAVVQIQNNTNGSRVTIALGPST